MSKKDNADEEVQAFKYLLSSDRDQGTSVTPAMAAASHGLLHSQLQDLVPLASEQSHALATSQEKEKEKDRASMERGDSSCAFSATMRSSFTLKDCLF